MRLSIETAAVISGGEGLTKFAAYSGKSAEEFKEQGILTAPVHLTDY